MSRKLQKHDQLSGSGKRANADIVSTLTTACWCSRVMVDGNIASNTLFLMNM